MRKGKTLRLVRAKWLQSSKLTDEGEWAGLASSE